MKRQPLVVRGLWGALTAAAVALGPAFAPVGASAPARDTVPLPKAAAAEAPKEAGAGLPSGTQRGLFYKVGQQFIDRINADDQAAIRELFAPSLKELMPEGRTSEMTRAFVRRKGKMVRLGTATQTGRTARFPVAAEQGEWLLRLTLDQQGAITGFYFDDPVPPIPVPERNRTPLSLPFRGEWFVVWGGENESQNYHVGTGSRSQRRALDFGFRDAAGKAFQGDGKKNEDFFAFGQEILAPAAGTVVMAVDGVPDNRPGAINPYTSGGNMLVIKHAAQEFSAFFHLQARSLAVKVGDAVKPGDVIARCGNSGNSSGPHLHFHLMNTDVPSDATGFPPFFRDILVTRDGATTREADYSPIKGDRIRPAPAPQPPVDSP